MNSFDSYVSQFTYPQEKDEETEKLRQQFLSRFPVSKLPTLTLKEYALGLEPKENSFCYWIEFKTRTLGGTGGGSSYKHVVFFRKKKQKWEYDPKFPNENVAFESVRNGLVTLVRLAAEGKYEELEDVEPFKGHNLTRGKILFLYYPDKFLPIFSPAHLRDLCQQLGITVDSDSQLAMNRALLAFKEAHSETKSWSNTKFMYCLYDKYSPTDQFWKIAPGENARF
jgi:5-methylcytosine-specific restriction protein B